MRSIIAMLLVGCGSSSSASDAQSSHDAPQSDAAPAITVVLGNLGGAAFNARDAIWDTATANGGGFNGMSTFVLLTDYAGACSVQMTGTGIPNNRSLAFFLAVTDAAGHATPIAAPGAYAVISAQAPLSSNVAEVYFEVDDATCRRSSYDTGLYDTVTVTSATNPQQATFDLHMMNGDHITGSYSASSCAALDPNRTPAC
jgi:hypothetical protein